MNLNLNLNQDIIIIWLSIIYLFFISQYNLHDFNTIGYSSNWFLHPENGGCCIFGQIMAFLTIFLLLFIIYQPEYLPTKRILYILSISWIILPFLMNNTWLSIACLPLGIAWIYIASLM
jgi:hypothetical protein